MNHDNRNRLMVELGGKWNLYTNLLPEGAEALGVVSHGGETGALVKLASGKYVQMNAGAIRSLDGRKVNAALGSAGRPEEMSGGKRVNVYLDAKSLAAAEKIGSGNVSEGIRKALENFEQN